MKNTRTAFAVVRFDKFLSDLQPLSRSFTVKEIVLTREEAESEVARLNELNKDKDREYFLQITRIRKPLADKQPPGSRE